MLLPVRHNDGRPVSAAIVEETREELVGQFRGLSYQPSLIRGIWTHEGTRYEDELLRFVIDVDDSPEARQFFSEFKAKLLQRFEQVEIYLVSYPIEVH